MPTRKKRLTSNQMAILTVLLGGLMTIGNTIAQNAFQPAEPKQAVVQVQSVQSPFKGVKGEQLELPQQQESVDQLEQVIIPDTYSVEQPKRFWDRVLFIWDSITQMDFMILIPLLLILIGGGHMIFELAEKYLFKKEEEDAKK